jgi:pyridoxamine 5'-phosphate oxidase
MQNSLQTPSDIRHRIWTELGRATKDRHHAWRTPVLASTAVDGLPDARTVVLREADANTAQLRIYSDGRSPKVSQLSAHPEALLVFWSNRLNWQLRVRVFITVHAKGPLVDAVWARVSQSAAAGDYLSPSAPGSALPEATPTAAQANHNLVVLSAEVRDIDWLELARSGHRRARLRADTWDWLTP